MRTRVKICGITRPEDALAAAGAGADAIGLVFYENSPRFVEMARAREICAVLPPFVSVVALFVNAPREAVRAVVDALPVDLLQFHGGESAASCEGFGRPYIKAVGMREGVDPLPLMRAHPAASAFLLDAYQPDSHGGGGVAFDWGMVPELRDRPLILAGGLKPENVADAIRQVRPFAVDVSSGVELEKGIKSPERINAFMRGVKSGDASQESE